MLNVANRYKAVQVRTSSPGEVLVMLFDGLFRFLGEARDAMTRDDRALAGDRIDRAHAILTELAASLNKSVEPELCENLEALYLFSSQKLLEANIHRDPGKIADAMRILDPIRDGFKIAIREQAAGQMR